MLFMLIECLVFVVISVFRWGILFCVMLWIDMFDVIVVLLILFVEKIEVLIVFLDGSKVFFFIL